MKQVTLLTFGRVQTPGLKQTEEYFLKLLSHWTKFNLVELKGEAASPKDKTQQLKALKTEASKIEAWLDKNKAPLICLSETGKSLTTVKWAKEIETLQGSGISSVALLVGSSFGIDETLLKRAHTVWSLGPQTLSHDLARVVLTEQIYRLFCVINKHPYHHI